MCIRDSLRNGLNDSFAHLGNRDDNIDCTANEHHGQRLLPSKPKCEYDRKHEERVEAHTGSLRIWDIGKKAHNEGADHRGNDGGEEHSTPRHTGLGKHARVDDNDVRHRKERCQAGHNLRAHVGVVFLQLKEITQSQILLNKIFICVQTVNTNAIKF